MSFGSRLKERREQLRLKQVDVGRKLNVTGAAIGNYEKGVSFPNADILYKIFDALQCDANYLFQDEMSDPADAESVRQTSLLNSFLQLNTEGQEKLVEYADDLVSSGKYIKTDPSLVAQNT